MDSIFISGSRKISRLNEDIQKRLENILKQGFTILVGDANGVDKAVQKFLYEKCYVDVLVYYSGDAPRNNIGHWVSKTVGQESRRRNFAFYAAKDVEMAREATFGLSIWDGRSKGTLSNIQNLLNNRKSVLLYLYPVKKFYVLKSVQNLERLMAKNAMKPPSTIKMSVRKPIAPKTMVSQLAFKENSGNY